MWEEAHHRWYGYDRCHVCDHYFRFGNCTEFGCTDPSRAPEAPLAICPDCGQKFCEHCSGPTRGFLCRLCQLERTILLLELPDGPPDNYRQFVRSFQTNLPGQREEHGSYRSAETINLYFPFCMVLPMPKLSAIPVGYFLEVIHQMRERSRGKTL